MTKPAEERRKHARLQTRFNIRVCGRDNVIRQAETKDLSPIGLRFMTSGEGINENDEIELAVEIPGALNPVHARAKVVWKRKISTEDHAPYDIGCEFTKIEEDNKNTFLKYFCDLLYNRVRQK